jgi:hypothetical protein
MQQWDQFIYCIASTNPTSRMILEKFLLPYLSLNYSFFNFLSWLVEVQEMAVWFSDIRLMFRILNFMVWILPFSKLRPQFGYILLSHIPIPTSAMILSTFSGIASKLSQPAIPRLSQRVGPARSRFWNLQVLSLTSLHLLLCYSIHQGSSSWQSYILPWPACSPHWWSWSCW